MEPVEHMPGSPLNLYVKLYCKKRKSLHNGVEEHSFLKEATKSWISLTDDEKQVFITKYNKTLSDYKQKIADCLKNVKPYLKKKNYKRSKRDGSVHRQDQYEVNFDNNIDTEDTKPITNVDDKMVSDIGFTENQQIPDDTNEHLNNFSQPPIVDYFPEPIPPKIKSGKELFEMLTTNTDNCKMWASLSTSEKRQYQNAVLSIKRNYIKSYRLFLENLQPKELYNYYIRNKEID